MRTLRSAVVGMDAFTQDLHNISFFSPDAAYTTTKRLSHLTRLMKLETLVDPVGGGQCDWFHATGRTSERAAALFRPRWKG